MFWNVVKLVSSLNRRSASKHFSLLIKHSCSCVAVTRRQRTKAPAPEGLKVHNHPRQRGATGQRE